MREVISVAGEAKMLLSDLSEQVARPGPRFVSMWFVSPIGNGVTLCTYSMSCIAQRTLLKYPI